MSNVLENSYEAIRKTRTPILIIFSLITFGIFWYIWLWKLITDINKLYPSKYIHRIKWFIPLVTLSIISIYLNMKGVQSQYLFNLADICWFFVQLLLALQILKNIENYIKYKFNIVIKHSNIGWICFGCFYINYKINRISKSIQKEINKQIEGLRAN